MSLQNDNEPSDAELVRQTRSGRMAAYAELARRWAAPVLAVCHARVRCRHAAEDLAQESLLRGLQALPTLHAPEKFGPWLRGIAQRVCLDWLKAKQSWQVPFTALSPEHSPDELLASDAQAATGDVDKADDLRQLMACVDALDDDLREVLLLYYYHDVTYRELADLLRVSSATVNARLTKARALLRERFAGKAGKEV